MENNELLTIQKYASLNRLSTHTVIKKTMSGELQTVVKEENGKEITYILNKTVPKVPSLDMSREDETEIDYKKAYEDLNKEYLVLKTKYEKLLNS